MISLISRHLGRAVVAITGLLGLSVIPAAPAAGFLTIHTFDPLAEGNTPYSVLIEGADGRLFGTTSTGGPYSNGTLFHLKTDGSEFTVFNAFPGTSTGSQPHGGLVQALDGKFYGTTYAGGASSEGTLFQITPAGALTYIASFADGVTPGANPGGTLVEARDGLLYGTAEFGGQSNFGTLYRFVPPTGVPATYAAFTGDVGGSYPRSDLVLGTDGNLYGTSILGGSYANGTFFRLQTGGAAAILYDFTGDTEGGRPVGGVVEGTDGAFYGANPYGGVYGAGAIYRIALNGDAATATSLYSFSPSVTDGANPTGRLMLASDGNFYGTAMAGGLYNNGCVFRVTPGGAYTTIYSFTNAGDGGTPRGGLVQASDGKLYGTTAPVNGSAGTVFQVDLDLPLPPPAPVSFLTNNVSVGDTIFIQGSHLVATTAVSFPTADGKTVFAATFQVISATVISAVVPSTAISGTVTVTANGTTTSVPGTLTIASTHPAFFAGEVAVASGIYYLQLPNGTPFGYYAYLSDPHYIYHFDLGYEYLIDAKDGTGGIYLYDFASSGFFYTSLTYSFPYLYDFKLNSVLYYFPDTAEPGSYTSNPRYFYEFKTGQIITK